MKLNSRPPGPVVTVRTAGSGNFGIIPFYLFLVLTVALLVSSFTVSGCSTTDVNVEEIAQEAGAPVVLVDQTGKEWDITTAVANYDMVVTGFEFGLGPYAIQPLIEPPLLSPGDRNYPPDDMPYKVLGVSIKGDPRAYVKLDIVKHEVVDEFIGGVPVAVAY